MLREQREGRKPSHTQTADDLTTQTENVFSSPSAPNGYNPTNVEATSELPADRINRGELEPHPTSASPSPLRKRDKIKNIFKS